jgi:protoporphyrinogen oxidase
MFGYVKGGYARILERFAERLDQEQVTVRLSHRAGRVEAVPGGGVRVAFDNGHEETFDRCVVTLPTPAAARLCPDLTDEERSRLTGVEYQGIVCASLLLKKPLAHYYVTNLTDAWVPFTAVIEMTALVDPAAFGGRSLVYLPRYLPADDPGFAVPDAEYERQFVGALEKMYPHFRRDDVLQFKVSRVKHVLPISTLNYSDRLPPLVTSVPGLYLVNSAHIVNGTLNVNETVQLAERGLEAVLADARARTRTEVPA